MKETTDPKTESIPSFPSAFSLGDDLRVRAEAMAIIAAEHADAVDRDGRFPAQAFAAAREQRLLGILVPAELGGEGGQIGDVVDICFRLGRACASTAMIFAMHQITVGILVRHAGESAWHRALLRRLAAEQLLFASSTTEGQGGGDLRRSSCAVERADAQKMTLIKQATVISYGAEADGILATARRSPEAAPSDQVLAVLLKEDYQLRQIAEWDALGMRGTRSAGFVLEASGGLDQILPPSYQTIHQRSMMPLSHLTWSAVWAGLAAGAVDRARLFTRGAARSGNGQLPPGAAHLPRAIQALRGLRGFLASALRQVEHAGEEEFDSLDFQLAMNLLKVNASEHAVAIVMSCVQACGLAGYRNDGAYSLSRHLRDVLSSQIMINNDRIIANLTNTSMMIEVPSFLRN